MNLWDSSEEEEEEVLVIPTRQQPVSQVEAMQVRKKQNRALYFSGHLILVENIYACQSEAKFLRAEILPKCLSLGNQSINFYKKNLKLRRQALIFSLLKSID